MNEVEFKIVRVAGSRVSVFAFALKTLAICGLMYGGGVQLSHAGQQTPTIRHIAVTGDDSDLGVEITATAPVTPQIQTVTDPDRLIIDFPGASPSSTLRKIPVNRGQLIDIRVGLLSANPRIARVVLDLVAPIAKYRVAPMGNTTVIQLGDESEPAAAAVAPIATPPSDAKPAEATSVSTDPAPVQPSQPSRARWILPILLVMTVMAMLVIAVVAHLQNKRGSRGL